MKMKEFGILEFDKGYEMYGPCLIEKTEFNKDIIYETCDTDILKRTLKFLEKERKYINKHALKAIYSLIESKPKNISMEEPILEPTIYSLKFWYIDNGEEWGIGLDIEENTSDLFRDGYYSTKTTYIELYNTL